MNKHIIVGAAFSMVLFSFSITDVLAAIPTSNPREMQGRREAGQVMMQQRVGSAIERISSRVEERFNRHEERLQNWIERAAQRITDMEGKGKNVTNVKKALETAKTSLATASQLGDDAIVKLKAVSAENWTGQKSEAQAAREAVRKAQVAYAQVIKDMQVVLKEMKSAQ